ncbi:unnamed protein product [Mesocestoides corti]|uniref:LITAF domain-containing protein n=1 Tax=Mesocestoides corti TaxID=53468 RepID=A0A0R3UQC8_MESCO|nr:unnamed protein product [Mesocestoides corti]VDD84080.1 unnamed protein product [Mesocestoides corti]
MKLLAVTLQPEFLQRDPTSGICPSCKKEIQTEVTYEKGTCAYVSCVVLALLGCDLGCCFIPFCVKRFKDAHHTCPKCNFQLGVRKP